MRLLMILSCALLACLLLLVCAPLSALDLSLPPILALRTDVGSDVVSRLLSSALAVNHANCHTLVRLLKCRSFDFVQFYRPDLDFLRELIPFILGNDWDAELVGRLLPLQHLSPTLNGPGWSLIAPHKDRLLKRMYIPGVNWRPCDWPIPERKVLLAEAHSIKRRHQLLNFDFCQALIGDTEAPEETWNELLSVAKDLWQLLDTNCAGRLGSKESVIPVQRHLCTLARQANIYALFQLASFRRLGWNTALVEHLLNTVIDPQVDTHRWTMTLTEPGLPDPRAVQEAFEGLLEHFEELAGRVAPITGTQYILSVLGLWLSHFSDNDGPVIIALHRLLGRFAPQEVIPGSLKRVLAQVTNWQAFMHADLPEAWLEVLVGDHPHWYLPLNRLAFADRAECWRRAVLTMCQSEARVFLDSLTLSGIVSAVSSYRRYPSNILWRRLSARNEGAAPGLFPVARDLVVEAERLLSQGDKVRIVDDEKGPMIKFDCAQSSPTVRLFLLGMLVRLALYVVRMPRLGPYLASCPRTPDHGLSESQQDLVRRLMCIDPEGDNVSGARVAEIQSTVCDFIATWQMGPTQYDLVEA